MSDWQFDTLSTPAPEAVFTYTAVVGTSVGRASFAFRSEVSPSKRLDAVKRAPSWSPRPWAGPRDASDRALTVAALQKIRTVLEFQSEIDETTPDGIRRALAARFPNLGPSQPVLGSVERPKSYIVEAAVRTDGEAEWGFITSDEGEDLPGLDSNDPDGALRVYLQNMTRASIIEALAKLS